MSRAVRLGWHIGASEAMMRERADHWRMSGTMAIVSTEGNGSCRHHPAHDVAKEDRDGVNLCKGRDSRGPGRGCRMTVSHVAEAVLEVCEVC
jgi:hypothetical protein